RYLDVPVASGWEHELALPKRCAREDQHPMKPSALRIERLLAKVEAELACSARPRRYVFHYDEVAEAEAQGLPYVLAPRVLSRESAGTSFIMTRSLRQKRKACPTCSHPGF